MTLYAYVIRSEHWQYWSAGQLLKGENGYLARSGSGGHEYPRRFSLYPVIVDLNEGEQVNSLYYPFF